MWIAFLHCQSPDYYRCLSGLFICMHPIRPPTLHICDLGEVLIHYGVQSIASIAYCTTTASLGLSPRRIRNIYLQEVIDGQRCLSA